MKTYDFSKGVRGPVLRRRGKTRITIRIDDDVLAWFRAQADAAGGGNYQTMINDLLRAAMEQSRAPASEQSADQLKESLAALTKVAEQLTNKDRRLEKLLQSLSEVSAPRRRKSAGPR